MFSLLHTTTTTITTTNSSATNTNHHSPSNMAVLNPVYAFIVPFLFIVTVPLAVFAGLTTTVAFSVLMLRVLAAYIDVALSLLPQYLSVGRNKPRPYRPGGRRPPQLQRFASPVPTATTGTTALSSSSNSPPSATPTPLRRRRRRRSSSALSATSLTPAASETALGLMPSIGPERDFEGVGGWRLGDDNDVDVWTTLNSRLELPDKQHHSTRSHHGHPSLSLCLPPQARPPPPSRRCTS